MLCNGTGVEVNLKEAAHYIKMSADKGHAHAFRNYGVMLENGKGVEVNLKDKIRYFKMSADNGNDFGIFKLAYMIYIGKAILIFGSKICSSKVITMHNYIIHL